jgi:hypothetical protein
MNLPTFIVGSIEMVNLKSCPFCGGKASDAGHCKYNRPLTNTWWSDGGATSGSGICSGYQTKAEAIAAWNTRKVHP